MEKNYINSITDNYKWGELGISGRLTKSSDCRAYFETGEISYNINLFETAKSVKKRKGRTGIDLTLGNETDEETSLPPSEPKVLRIRNSQQGAIDSALLVFPVMLKARHSSCMRMATSATGQIVQFWELTARTRHMLYTIQISHLITGVLWNLIE